MNNFMIPAAFVIAFLFALIFGAFFSKRTFWRGFFLFFFIIFLAGWSSQLWITPYGPVLWGVSWLSLFFVTLIFSLLIIALIPPVNISPVTTANKNAEETSAVAFGVFFWFLIILLITSIAVGYYRIPPM
ncbi:MAG: hypothetical protein HYU69_05850 [Bacteroidetes bacterium]|nr:hypothetical protein [Bacteroidota bacterium]